MIAQDRWARRLHLEVRRQWLRGHESFAHENARDGSTRHQQGVSATDFFKAVRFVELDSCERGLDVDTCGSFSSRMRFDRPQESGANSTS